MAEPPNQSDRPIVPTAGVCADAETSLILVRRANKGDQAAIDELFARYLPRLQSGRTAACPPGPADR
jgi:hypothetical protein